MVVVPAIKGNHTPEWSEPQCYRPFHPACSNGAKTKTKPSASKEKLIRRAYYDLIGLPPTPEQIDAFLHDESPQAFEKVVDELLASPRYGEKWARHWLDVARYAEAAAMSSMAFVPERIIIAIG